MIKKLIPFILMLLIVTACSQEAVTLIDFMGLKMEKSNYEGRTIVIDGGPYFIYEDDYSPQTDALRKRLADVQKNLNVVFDYCEEGLTEISTIVGNVYTADIIFRWEGASLVPFAHGGMLYPMNGFPEYIDLSDTDKYGTPGATEAALAKGVPYGIQPTYWPGMQGIECFLLTYNKEMLAQLGLTDLHEYYENKTWVWDTLYDILEEAEKLVPEDNITFRAHTAYLMNTIFLSNGFDYITITDGEPLFNVVTPDAVHAVEYMSQLSDLEKTLIDSRRWSISHFVDGKALMTMAVSKDVTVGEIAYDSEFDYGIMPFPCGPDAKYGNWAQSVTRIYGFAIPLSCPVPDIAAHVLSELFEPFEEFGSSREELKNYYATNVFITPIDAEIYFDVDRNVRYDYDDVGFIESFVAAVASAAKTKNGSPAEILQRHSTTAKQIYDAYMAENLEGYLIEKMNITE